MAAIRKFEDVFAWKEARQLAFDVYALVKRKPFSDDFALRNQICRAVISISSNIAEGFERGSDKAFVSFLSIARGSASEVRSQLYLALDFGYLSNEEFNSLTTRCQSVSNAITAFISYLSQRSSEVHEDSVLYDSEEIDHYEQ